MIDEQGDARPAPRPPETKSLWQWPAFYAAVLGAATLALILTIAHFSFRANLTTAQSMGWAPLYATIAYLLVCAAILGLTIRHLARV